MSSHSPKAKLSSKTSSVVEILGDEPSKFTPSLIKVDEELNETKIRSYFQTRGAFHAFTTIYTQVRSFFSSVCPHS